MSVRNWQWSGMLLIVCGWMLGCNDTPRVPEPTTPQSAAPDSTPVDDPAVVAVLEQGEPKIQRDRAGHIVTLDYRGREVTPETAELWPQLPRLQALILSEVAISADILQHISACVGLRQLDLRDCPLTNADLPILAPLENLRALRLSGKSGATSVDDEGLPALQPLTSLKVLALDFLWVSGEGLNQLGALSGLEELYLASTLLADEDLAALQHFPNLKKLRVSKLSQITGTGIEQIAQLSHLEDLDLSENSALFDNDIAPLAGMTTLRRLNLWRVALTDAGVAHLAGLVNLEWLNLDNTQLTDAGLKSLSGMQKLTFLHLGSTSISDAGLPELAGLKSLRDLKVTRTAVTQAGVAELSQQLPDTQIQLKYIEGE
jgi:hypothetical protein